MKIALINENSQAAKNAVIYGALKKVADTKGYSVDNYGMYAADDKAQLTYVQNGILAAVLLKQWCSRLRRDRLRHRRRRDACPQLIPGCYLRSC